VVFTALQVLLRSLLWLPIALGLLLLYPPDPALSGQALVADREVTFVRGMVELLPSGARGLMLTAMLAALASTIDTHLNWGASYWTNDLYGRFWCQGLRRRTPSDRALVRVARLSNFFILMIALFVMTKLSSIQAAWQLSLLLGAGMGVPLVLRWLWWRLDAWGEIAAIGASAALAPILLFTVDDEAVRLLALAFASALAAVGVSLATGGESLARLRAFHDRVRPPGFWGPAAGTDAADDVRVLYRGLAATASGALAVFCLLVGIGSWLVGGAAPTWWPAPRSVWLAACLVTGFVLVPLTARLANPLPGDESEPHRHRDSPR
jgi:hypothetical protein